MLRRQPFSSRSDQAWIGRLELVDGPAEGALHVDILVVLATKREIGRRGVAIRQRDVADDETA
jgi:hypothetical protein